MAAKYISNPRYFIDNVKFLFIEKTCKELKNALPLKKLKKHSYRIIFKPKFRSTTLNLSCPDKDCLSLLLEHESELGKYFITYIEIAMDYAVESVPEARKLTEIVAKKIIVKNLYEQINLPDDRISKRKRKQEKRFIGKRSHYWQNATKIIRLVMYPAHSKPFLPQNRVPSIHIEWRLRKRCNIRKYTGISTVSDLINFNCERFFTDMSRKRIKLKAINHKIHGKNLLKSDDWIIGLNASIFAITGSKLTAKEASKMYCKICKISSAAKLRHHHLKEKNDEEGNVSSERKNYYRISSFLKDTTYATLICRYLPLDEHHH